jgi:hypothetical protein
MRESSLLDLLSVRATDRWYGRSRAAREPVTDDPGGPGRPPAHHRRHSGARRADPRDPAARRQPRGARDGRNPRYEPVPGLDPNEFDRQMMALIDQDPVLPLRLTNRHGLLGDRAAGFHDPVDGDAFRSGYVDIDDLLAGDERGIHASSVDVVTRDGVVHTAEEYRAILQGVPAP